MYFFGVLSSRITALTCSIFLSYVKEQQYKIFRDKIYTNAKTKHIRFTHTQLLIFGTVIVRQLLFLHTCELNLSAKITSTAEKIVSSVMTSQFIQCPTKNLYLYLAQWNICFWFHCRCFTELTGSWFMLWLRNSMFQAPVSTKIYCYWLNLYAWRITKRFSSSVGKTK